MPAAFQWHSPFCSVMNQDNNTTDLSRNSAVREVWIDWIRAVGSVGIVALHVVTREKVRRVGEVDGFDWWSLTTYETVTRIAVPLFFMVSGYLAIGRCVKHGDSAYA